MLSKPKFHVIIPTHSANDTLKFSVLSALEQSLPPEKIIIIGDGATAEVSKVATTLENKYRSVEFIDNPKIANRGEKYREQVIRSSDADFISYLCDDDLMLPYHLEVMFEHLDEFDFVHPRPTFINSDGTIWFIPSGIEISKIRKWHRLSPPQNSISLTGASHKVSSYRSLDKGWEAGPANIWTDLYMWVKWFSDPNISTYTSEITTTIKILYTNLQRELHNRQETIERWYNLISSKEGLAEFEKKVECAFKEYVFDVNEKAKLVDALLSEQVTLLAEKQSLLSERELLLRSNSWRLTAPLRTIRRKSGVKLKALNSDKTWFGQR